MFFKRKKKKGFTLVEILVSISILVTILAIVTKLLFDFSRSAYRVSFQIKNTETIRNIFRKLEYTFIRSRTVIYKYEIERGRPGTVSELKGKCQSQIAPFFAPITCMEVQPTNLPFDSGLNVLRSGKDMIILSAPVFSKAHTDVTTDTIDRIDTAQSGGIETIGTIIGSGGLIDIYGYYPYTQLPKHGDYLTSDPLDVDQPPGIGPAYPTASKNDVFILYRDGERNLRMYQLPSLAVVPTVGAVTHQGEPYSRYQDGFLPDGITPKYSYKGNILGVKLASGIEKTITTFVNDVRTETPYNIFTYYTPTEELKFEDNLLAANAKNVSSKLKSATDDEKKAIGLVTAVRIKLTKSSDYEVKSSDNVTSGIYEPSTYRKRIDEKTKETLFRLNRSDTIN